MRERLPYLLDRTKHRSALARFVLALIERLRGWIWL